MIETVTTECASCFVEVTLTITHDGGAAGEWGIDTFVSATLTSRIPSNGLRGAKYVAPYDAHAEAVPDADGTLLLWECVACGYADSTYLDPAVRDVLA